MNTKDLKKAVADACIVGARNGVKHAAPLWEMEVECESLSALSLRVRVKTRDMGTHYYTVKISEVL